MGLERMSARLVAHLVDSGGEGSSRNSVTMLYGESGAIVHAVYCRD